MAIFISPMGTRITVLGCRTSACLTSWRAVRLWFSHSANKQLMWSLVIQNSSAKAGFTGRPHARPGQWGPRCALSLWALSCFSACEMAEPPGAVSKEPQPITLGAIGPTSVENSGAAAPEFGTLDDNLPFSPNGEKLASIAWRTWIYTDTGPKRTRLGYLRAGAVVDARGPLIKNDGCGGGWLRINPRGFVCLGKGATQDLNHPVVKQYEIRPTRGEGFPYQYAKSRERAPDRYFRLPTPEQMLEIEGRDVIGRGENWKQRAKEQGLLPLLDVSEEVPSFLRSGASLQKPYGVEQHLQRQVHAGRASTESGFALLDMFYFNDRAFGLSTEMDLLPLDRLYLVEESYLRGLALDDERTLPVAFHVKGGITLWRRGETGHFLPDAEQHEKRGFYLTGEVAPGGMIEAEDEVWLVRSSVRVVEPRDGFPSVATGRRKWIDISTKHQTLVAYEGTKPVYATLISAGRGGLGKKGESNPDGNRTVRGTFMIHEKSVSSTMDGDEDRADSFELQDVPFVQYFHRGFALHGAYWHDEFGKERSHGCINLAPRDSAWLFEWSDPQVPDGWHAALNKTRGTVVYIHP